MTTAGIDSGAKNTKTVILKDGVITGRGRVLTGFDLATAVDFSLDLALENAGIGRMEIDGIAGTGSGKEAITVADIRVNEIQAMANSARFFSPAARTVADVGAEEGKAAKLDEAGNPIDSVNNERCAAGAGTFIESMAHALGVTIEEMEGLCLKPGKEIHLKAQCAVFAESEVVKLIHAKTAKADISWAVHDAMAGRIASMIQRIGILPDMVMLGGVAGNAGFMKALKRQLGIQNIFVPEGPEYGLAVGAALQVFREKRSRHP